MERLGPEEDPIRSALTSTSGKYAGKDVQWGSIFCIKYFLVFYIEHRISDMSLSFSSVNGQFEIVALL